MRHDPDRAKEFLRQAGWCDTDGDGVRDKNGEPLRFTALVPGRWFALDRAAVYVQEQLARVGVGMELQTLELPVVRRRVLAGGFEAAVYPIG